MVGASNESNDFTAMLDDSRIAEASRERSALAWEGHINREEMTFHGSLLALAEAQSAVTIRLVNGTTNHGIVTAVGTDVLAFQRQSGAGRVDVLFTLDAVESVRSSSNRLIASNRAPASTTLREQLLVLVEKRSVVRVEFRSGGDESGIIEACGLNVCVLKTEQRSFVYVPLVAIICVTGIRS
jgi:hypothetical protein